MPHRLTDHRSFSLTVKCISGDPSAAPECCRAGGNPPPPRMCRGKCWKTETSSARLQEAPQTAQTAQTAWMFSHELSGEDEPTSGVPGQHPRSIKLVGQAVSLSNDKLYNTLTGAFLSKTGLQDWWMSRGRCVLRPWHKKGLVMASKTPILK